LMPFLPEHMSRLGHSATLVGAILAVRLLSQQGTMPLTGALADRWGCRRSLLAGLGIRAAGFALLAVATSALWLAVSALLSGLGGSLIGAAYKAIYTEAPGRADLPTRFLWLTVADRLGQAIGPLLGAAAGSFAAGARVSVLLFLGVMLAVWIWLPADRGSPGGPIWTGLLAQVRNRRLVALVAVLCGYWALQQQLSVLIPLAAARQGLSAAVGPLFSLSALAGLVLLLVLPRNRPQHLWQRLAVAMALTAGAMAAPGVLPGLAGIVTATAGLAVAAVLGQPAIDALAGSLAPAGALASAYGFVALSFGLGGAAGQVLGGWLWSRWGDAAWFCFAGLGFLTLAALQLVRKGVDLHARGS
ncbi:MAG TPA: MFS transporter, partial [Symbiobacteriaceae bacterium]|nr:MFS transporter [Symbiobacteriaceae bacterium]